MIDGKARALRSEDEKMLRRTLLGEAHVATLAAFAKKLREDNPGLYVPEFDPLDGGVDARFLFLFEKPGPKTFHENGGSGFISRDNDDFTAESTFNFMRMAGFDRKETIIWNVIPGWNGTIKIRSGEVQSGYQSLSQLLELLPKLEAVIFVGKKAATAATLLSGRGLRIVRSAHPSSKVKAVFRSRWDGIPESWRSARNEQLP